MTYRDVLVHVKYHETWSPHIDVAGHIAQTFGARLTGLYTMSDIAAMKTVMGARSQSVLDRQARDAEKVGKAEAAFRAFLERTKLSGDWKVGEGNASDLLRWSSRFNDLVVIEQTDLGTDEPGLEAEIQCVMGSGRPTLIVPSRGTFPSVGKRILIAWNGSREAALAVHGALPFIERAEHVELLIGRGKEVFSSVTRYPAFRIADYLAERARNIRTRAFEPPDAQAGAEILKAAAEAEADLIVMGAFARSWFREWIFGGATLHVLRSMKMPVLMAH
ncbi:MAG: universal stress protein [Alphaproteobacteria bacterium]|nr:universal stress protein [Alphaproteobacteria bacterium]